MKSEKNLFTIGEMAKAVGITRRIILNYEKKGLIKPDKKDGITANRYYSVDTFTQIRTIRLFQNFGLSLDEIKDYLNDRTDLDHIIKRFETMRDKLNLTIEKLKERSNGASNLISEITTEPQTVYVRTYDSKSTADKTVFLRNTALEALKLYGTDITKHMYFTEYCADTPQNISYCVAIPKNADGEFIKHIPPLDAIAVFHHGGYDDIPKTRQLLINYAKDNNISLSGTFRHLYLEGPPQHNDQSKFVTQIIAIKTSDL